MVAKSACWCPQHLDRANSRPTGSGRHSRGNEVDPVEVRHEIDWRICPDDRCHLESFQRTANAHSEKFCLPSQAMPENSCLGQEDSIVLQILPCPIA